MAHQIKPNTQSKLISKRKRIKYLSSKMIRIQRSEKLKRKKTQKQD